MISLHELNELKKRKEEKKGEEEKFDKYPPDVQMRKLNDQYTRTKNKQKNQEIEEMEEFSRKLKPILSLHTNSLEEVLKKIPKNQHVQASFLLQVLSRLPKTSIQRDYILIDGEPLPTSASDIVKQMINNGMVGTQNIINAMRFSGNEWEDVDESLPFMTPVTSKKRKLQSLTPARPRSASSTPARPRSAPSSVRKTVTPLRRVNFEDDNDGSLLGAMAPPPIATPKSRKKKTPGIKSRFQPSRVKPYASPRLTLEKLRESRKKENFDDLAWDGF